MITSLKYLTLKSSQQFSMTTHSETFFSLALLREEIIQIFQYKILPLNKDEPTYETSIKHYEK